MERNEKWNRKKGIEPSIIYIGIAWMRQRQTVFCGVTSNYWNSMAQLSLTNFSLKITEWYISPVMIAGVPHQLYQCYKLSVQRQPPSSHHHRWMPAPPTHPSRITQITLNGSSASPIQGAFCKPWNRTECHSGAWYISVKRSRVRVLLPELCQIWQFRLTPYTSLCLSAKTIEGVGPPYIVSMLEEVKYTTEG